MINYEKGFLARKDFIDYIFPACANRKSLTVLLKAETSQEEQEYLKRFLSSLECVDEVEEF